MKISRAIKEWWDSHKEVKPEKLNKELRKAFKLTRNTLSNVYVNRES